MRVVVAIGGNAFVAPGASLTVQGELGYARDALACPEPFIGPAVELVVTHGNGPQVGHQLDRAERSRESSYALPLDVCVAQTQGELGYILAQALREVLARRGVERPVAALVTQVEVDEGDAAFQRPSKPVGPLLDAEGKEALCRRGLTVGQDARGGYRRVVPSPEPRRVLEADAIRMLLAAGVAVVACGGGGVPIVPVRRGCRGVEAVIDKDLTSALLADVIGAEILVILTDVPCAYTAFRTPYQAPVQRVTSARARALLSAGHFAPGSMAPKIEACARFASVAGRRAVVCDPPRLAAALRGESGTIVVPDD